VLTAWQQAIVAAVFELCLVGVMVIYELLGHAKRPAEVRMGNIISNKTLATGNGVEGIPQLTKMMAHPRRRKAITTSPKAKGGSINSFVREHVSRVDGERVDMKTLMYSYRTWCGQNGFAPIDLNGFLDEIENVCRRLGIPIEASDDQRVYCCNVKLRTGAASAPIGVH
jgi:hypothetical protein